jgi:enterochelin esterase-like enzyme
VSHFVVRSRFVHARLRETLVVPAGDSPRPLLVFLHGRGMGEDGSLSAQMFAALAAQGERAPEHPRRFCAVGGHSPAIWTSSGQTAPGAFDNASDFARNDLVRVARSTLGAFAGKPLWLDAGTADPFDPGDRAFIAALRSRGLKVTLHRWPGGHTGAYWRSHWKSYLGFYARALANCQRS